MCLQDLDKVRQRVVEQMCSIAAIRSVPASSKTLILKFLAMHAYFAVDKSAAGKVLHVLRLSLCVGIMYLSIYAGFISVIDASFTDGKSQALLVQKAKPTL